MAYADQLATVLTHARDAGNAISPAITDVVVAYPSPRGRCIRIFYGGEVEPVRMGAQRVLNEEMVGEQIVIVAFWPLNNLSEDQAAGIEVEAYNLKHQLRTRILADSQLGGMSTDLELGYADPGFANLAGIPYRTLEMIVNTDYTSYTLGA